MRAAFRRSFLQDVRKIKDRRLRAQVEKAIAAVESAPDLGALPDLRKLAGPGPFYRLRVGDYRLGLAVGGGTVEFVRCLHRREIYRFFP